MQPETLVPRSWDCSAFRLVLRSLFLSHSRFSLETCADVSKTQADECAMNRRRTSSREVPTQWLIHRSAWNRCSRKFAFKEFSEVRRAPVQPLSASPAEIGTRRVLS